MFLYHYYSLYIHTFCVSIQSMYYYCNLAGFELQSIKRYLLGVDILSSTMVILGAIFGGLLVVHAQFLDVDKCENDHVEHMRQIRMDLEVWVSFWTDYAVASSI